MNLTMHSNHYDIYVSKHVSFGNHITANGNTSVIYKLTEISYHDHTEEWAVFAFPSLTENMKF